MRECQKCRWNDLLLRDLRKIDPSDDWRSKAMDRNEWKLIVRESVNKSEEAQEKKQKDERKHRRES